MEAESQTGLPLFSFLLTYHRAQFVILMMADVTPTEDSAAIEGSNAGVRLAIFAILRKPSKSVHTLPKS